MGFFTPKPVGKSVSRVKVLGVRTAADSKLLATYNYGIYCLLVEYDDGSREIVEAELGSNELEFYIDYIEW